MAYAESQMTGYDLIYLAENKEKCLRTLLDPIIRLGKLTH